MQPRITVGRRKNAIARVKLIDGSGKILVNEREFENYFPLAIQRDEIMKPFQGYRNLGTVRCKDTCERRWSCWSGRSCKARHCTFIGCTG